MNTAVIQVRYKSTRFLGKALMPFRKKPLLQYIINRVTPVVDNVVVATDKDSVPIIAYCRQNNIPCVWAETDDIVKRLYLAAYKMNSSVIVRIWGDSPLTSVSGIKQYLDEFEGYDFADTQHPDDCWGKGLDFEIYSARCIIRIMRETKNPRYREFPVEYVLSHDFKRLHIHSEGRVNETLCIDYPEDIKRVENENRHI